MAADHRPPVTGSQSRKGAIAASERHYLPNCKQASLLTRLLGVLDGQHPPEKVRWLYTQKTEWQEWGQQKVTATALAKDLVT